MVCKLCLCVWLAMCLHVERKNELCEGADVTCVCY